MTGTAYATSAEMAKELGPFKAYKHNREHMLRVIRNHRRASLRCSGRRVRRADDQTTRHQ